MGSSPCFVIARAVDVEMDALVKSHIVQGYFPVEKLQTGLILKTLSGLKLEVVLVPWPRSQIRLVAEDGTVLTTVVGQEISECNGVVHVADAVIDPWSADSKLPRTPSPEMLTETITETSSTPLPTSLPLSTVEQARGNDATASPEVNVPVFGPLSRAAQVSFSVELALWVSL